VCADISQHTIHKCGKAGQVHTWKYLKVGFTVNVCPTIRKKTALVICKKKKLPNLEDASNFFFNKVELKNTEYSAVTGLKIIVY
jgi:hypothetical protein